MPPYVLLTSGRYGFERARLLAIQTRLSNHVPRGSRCKETADAQGAPLRIPPRMRQGSPSGGARQPAQAESEGVGFTLRDERPKKMQKENCHPSPLPLPQRKPSIVQRLSTRRLVPVESSKKWDWICKKASVQRVRCLCILIGRPQRALCGS